MNLAQIFRVFQDAGIKAVPVPGTDKYFLRFRDGDSIYIREATLFTLAQSLEEPAALPQVLREARRHSVSPRTGRAAGAAGG